MFAVVQNGEVRQVLQLDVAFSVGDKHYSSNFLRTSSPQEKLEAGVWEIIEGARPDDRYYWVTGPTYRVNEVGQVVEASYSGTAKDLEPLKATTVAQIKVTASSMLSATDWTVIRKAERGIEIPADVALTRTAIVAECNRLEAAINAATTVEEIVAVLSSQVWTPNQPAQE